LREVSTDTSPLAFPSPDNNQAVHLGNVAQCLVRGDREQARRLLQSLVGVTRVTQPIELLPTLTRELWPSGLGPKTRNPSVAVIAAVYVRDGFTCLYCGRWTIPTQILRLISTAFPAAFPYHPNWRKDIAPRAYWDISTSIDHVDAVSTGGDWQAITNLATACARCQYQKSNLPLEALGWSIQHDRQTWDGLTAHYEALWNELGKPDAREHSTWIRNLAKAEEAQRSSGHEG
jgi:hypothetical protein